MFYRPGMKFDRIFNRFYHYKQIPKCRSILYVFNVPFPIRELDHKIEQILFKQNRLYYILVG